MSKRKPRVVAIRDVHEIPDFVSEDEEREWWATHDFSDELLERLRPTAADLEDLLVLGLRAREAAQVQLPLFIAAKHLSYIKRRGSRPLRISTDVKRDDVRLHHALVSIVFTAMAVEAGLNLYITAPALLVAAERPRRFFGLLSSKYARLSIPRKLSFVAETCPALADSASMDRMRKLFRRRDALVHPALGLAVREEGWEEIDRLPSSSRTARPSDFITQPALTTFGGPSSEDIDKAFDYYGAAVEFLDALHLGALEEPSSCE